MVGIEENLEAPALNEAEVTLIGSSAGFGETIIIHIGNGFWIVVDSCINPTNGENVALAYLNELSINIQEQLRYVICSHWHEDHIKGLSELINSCSNKTVLALSCADDREKFIYEMMEKSDYSGNSSTLKELSNSINAANEKGIKIKRVYQDHLIFNKEGTECFALSPSTIEIEKFNQELADAHLKYHKSLKQMTKLNEMDPTVIQEATEIAKGVLDSFTDIIADQLDEEFIPSEQIDNLLNYKDVKKIEANDRCVAMLLKIHGHCIVLGADLEYNSTRSPDGGWHSVAECECMENVHANLFKIPHHGSDTGYYEYFLQKFIKNEAVFKLTSWVKGSKVLPKAEMLMKYYNHSKRLFITTTSLLKKKNLEKDRTIRKIMNNTAEEIYEFKPQLGIVRSRINIDSSDDTWQTQCFGSAKLIEKDYLDNLE